MRYLTGVYWCRGREADKNQDSVILQQVLTRRGRVLMAAVCDGMGGASQGETASGYVSEELQEWFYTELLYMIREKKRSWVIRRSLDRLAFHLQRQLRCYAGQEEISLGTTMTVLVIWEKKYLVWHLGDSRAYRLRGERMEQITTDHVHETGKLTKCLGSFDYFTPEHAMGLLRPGEAMLLCSDGFWRQVTSEEITGVMNPAGVTQEEQIERRLREIGEACMKRGERDNLSGVYVKSVR